MPKPPAPPRGRPLPWLSADLHAHLFQRDADHCPARRHLQTGVAAGVDTGQLPGARVFQKPAKPACPPGQARSQSAADWTSMHLANQYRLPAPPRWPRWCLTTRSMRLRQLGAHGLAGCIARLLQRHQPVPARARPEKTLTRAGVSGRHARHREVVPGHRPGRAQGRTARALAYTPQLATTNWWTARWKWATSGAVKFTAGGVPHRFVVAGAAPRLTAQRLLADTQKICETAIRFWHGQGKPPHTSYLFMLNAVNDGYGGLEHRNSTALIARAATFRARARRAPARATPRCWASSATNISTPGTSSACARRDFRLRLRRRKTTAQLLWFFRRLYQLLRRPAAAPLRPD
jgi:hypothetical protein